MPEPYVEMLASGLAALSAAAFVCALFYPVLAGERRSRRQEAFLAGLKMGASSGRAAETRELRRAQKFALKAVAEAGRTRRASRLREQLAAAGLTVSPHRFVLYSALFGLKIFCAGLIAWVPSALALTGAVVGGWLLPLRVLKFLAERRQRMFLAGFAPAVDMIVRGAKSGLSVPDCLSVVAADANPLVRKEFNTVVAQLRAGVPLPEAMAKLSAAMPVAEVRFFALIMSMQNQTGGNLSNALTNLSKVLRDRQQLAAKVRVASAEVRASAIAVGLMPLVVIGAVMVLSPSYIALLWMDETGRGVAIAAAMWMAIGVAVLRRMSRIEP
jgi:tight adherence protein B